MITGKFIHSHKVEETRLIDVDHSFHHDHCNLELLRHLIFDYKRSFSSRNYF